VFRDATSGRSALCEEEEHYGYFMFFLNLALQIPPPDQLLFGSKANVPPGWNGKMKMKNGKKKKKKKKKKN